MPRPLSRVAATRRIITMYWACMSVDHDGGREATHSPMRCIGPRLLSSENSTLLVQRCCKSGAAQLIWSTGPDGKPLRSTSAMCFRLGAGPGSPGREDPGRALVQELARALPAALDDEALEELATRLRPHLGETVGRASASRSLLMSADAARRADVHVETVRRAIRAGDLAVAARLHRVRHPS
jgi:hypothetical protein